MYEYKLDKWLVDKSCDIFEMKTSLKKICLMPLAIILAIIDFMLYGWIPFAEENKFPS